MIGAHAWIDALPAIDLVDAVSHAELLDRVDRKYVLPRRDVDVAVAGLTGVRVLDIDGIRRFGYLTVYYDTPVGDLLLAAARRRPRRAKVRTRTYLDSGASYFELKLRERTGRAVKLRWERHGDPWSLDAHERTLLADHEVVAPHADELAPVIVTEYRRTTLVIGEQRATVDTGLVTRPVGGAGVGVGEHVIVETKSPDHLPGPLDRALWRLGHRPQRFSKFAVGAVCARADLPANPWHRAIHRYVVPGRSAVDAGASALEDDVDDPWSWRGERCVEQVGKVLGARGPIGVDAVAAGDRHDVDRWVVE